MCASLSQSNFWLELPKVLSQNLVCYYWLRFPGKSQTMHCGILLTMFYSCSLESNMYYSPLCPDKTWYFVNDHCVKITSSKFTRDQGQTLCRKLGGDLFRPESTTDLHNLQNLIDPIWTMRWYVDVFFCMACTCMYVSYLFCCNLSPEKQGNS